jgi:hypothetical protein
MKAQRSVLPILVVCTVAFALSCGRGSDNPAAPEAATPTAAAPSEDEDVVDMTGGAEVTASRHVSIPTWSVRDGCADNRGIRFRFFDMRTGGRSRILTLRSGQSRTIRLLCLTGNQQCVGGEQNPRGSLSFGVGINGDKKPTAAACKACLNRRYSTIFTCSRRASGDIGLVVDEEGFEGEE